MTIHERRYRTDPESGCGLLLVIASTLFIVGACALAAYVFAVWGAR